MKIKIKMTIVYYILLLLFLFRMMIMQLSLNINIDLIVTILTILFFVVAIVLYVYNIFRYHNYLLFLLFLPLVILIFYISARNSKDSILLYSIIIIALSYKINFRSIVKTYFYFLFFWIIAAGILSAKGIINNKIFYFSYGVGKSWGFSHSNVLGVTILCLVLSWLYLFWDIKFRYILLVSIFGFAIEWMVAAARTSAIIMVLIPVTVLIVRITKKIHFKRIYILTLFVFLLCLIVSIILMNFYANGPAGVVTNDKVRFTSAYILSREYGIHLLGSHVILVGTLESALYHIPAVILDCAYLRLLIVYGIIPTILMTVFNMFIAYKAYINKNDAVLGILCLFCVLGFMEQYILYAAYNFILLYLFSTDTINFLISES